MQSKQVKDYIKEKFGSLSRFCMIVGIDRYVFQKFFAALEKKATPAREKKLRAYYRQAMRTSDKRQTASELTPLLRENVKKGIEEKFGTVAKFVEQHPEFNKVSIYQVIDGFRQRKTPMVTNLLIALDLC